MTIQYSKSFEKQFAKLSLKDKRQFIARQATFVQNQHDPILRVHALRGKYQGYYSLDIKGDMRALFMRNGSTIIIFGYVGSHSQLY
jgi:addiction module RelE/StbE family toxin